MLTQNKWVTHGILFDVNSANIKPESYGTMKEMANVLKEYADMKVKIIGHTDGDGNDASNLDLSKRRAASVKAALAKEFGIDETRMETDGKGESEPIDKNESPSAKQKTAELNSSNYNQPYELPHCSIAFIFYCRQFRLFGSPIARC